MNFEISYETTLDLALQAQRDAEYEDAAWLFGAALERLCDQFDPIRRADRLGALLLILERAGLHELAQRAAHAMLSLEDRVLPAATDATAMELDRRGPCDSMQRELLHSCLGEAAVDSPAAASAKLGLLMGALGQTQHALLLLNKSLGELEQSPDPELEQRTRNALHRTLDASRVHRGADLRSC